MPDPMLYNPSSVLTDFFLMISLITVCVLSISTVQQSYPVTHTHTHTLPVLANSECLRLGDLNNRY